jgi:hypothetical protein
VRRSGSHGLQGEELEEIFLVEPRTLEDLHWKSRTGCKRESINNKLVDRVDLASLRLVVKQVDKAISNLHDVDVSRDWFG